MHACSGQFGVRSEQSTFRYAKTYILLLFLLLLLITMIITTTIIIINVIAPWP